MGIAPLQYQLLLHYMLRLLKVHSRGICSLLVNLPRESPDYDIKSSRICFAFDYLKGSVSGLDL